MRNAGVSGVATAISKFFIGGPPAWLMRACADSISALETGSHAAHRACSSIIGTTRSIEVETSHFLQYAVMFLAAAVVAVSLSKRWGLGAVLGYLGAGALIGPHLLNLTPDMRQASEFSEFGVILLLFIIGLELSPQRLWLMRRAVFGAGTLQVVLSALLLGGVAFAAGLAWKSALIVGLSLALSSTAIGLQTLAERKEAGSPHG